MIIKEVLIKKLDFYSKNKQGQPYINKDGRAYTRAVLTDSQGIMYSGFLNEIVGQWQVGQTVKINIESHQYSGQTRWNFKTLSREDELELRLEELERYLPLLKKMALAEEVGKQNGKISVVEERTTAPEIGDVEPADFIEDLPF